MQLENMGTMAVVPQEVVLPVPRSKLALVSTPEVAQVALPGPEVAGGAAVRGSWDHMWCWPEVEVQQLEVAGGGYHEVQQLEVAGGGYLGSEKARGQQPGLQSEVDICGSVSDQFTQGGLQLEVDIRVRQQMLHALMVAQSEGTVGVSAYGLESYKSVEPGWMRQHELDGDERRGHSSKWTSRTDRLQLISS